MTLAALSDEIAAFNDDLADAVLPKAGPRLRETALAAARRDAHGRIARRTLDADVDRRGDTLTILPTPRGPWTLLDSGSRKRQWWEPRATGRGHKRLRIGNDVRVRVLHGPVRGKRTWTKATDAMADEFFATAYDEAAALWRTIHG